ncbi:MAG: hypothetical protein U1E65_32835 [Myxococcota bacterium]
MRILGIIALAALAAACEGSPSVTVLPGTGFFTPATLSFGTRPINKQYSLTTKLTPDATVQVNDITLDPSNDAYAARLANGSTLRGALLTRGKTEDISILFNPRDPVDYAANMIILFNDGRRISLELKGAGRMASATDIAVTPEMINFGSLEVGREVSQPLEIENVSEDQVTVSAVTMGDATTPLPETLRLTTETSAELALPVTLEVGQKVRTRMRFHPTDVLTLTSTLVFSSVGMRRGETRVHIDARAVAAGDVDCEVGEVDFGSVPRGSLVDKTLHCTVVGGRYTLDSATPAAANPNLFEILNNPVMPTAYINGDTFQLVLRFRGEGLPSVHTGQLNLRSAIGLTRVIGLRGTVSAPATNSLQISASLGWDTLDTDLDLHLVRNGQLAFSATDDCSYQLKNPDWGTANYPNDDPYLDADVTSGGGPEVIDLLSAAESTYDLYVHYYESTLKPSTTATLTVYSHGTEIGSTVQAGMACGDLWHAGRIQMQAGAPVFTPAGGITPRTDRAMCH